MSGVDVGRVVDDEPQATSEKARITEVVRR
jgi:hypothetical protein